MRHPESQLYEIQHLGKNTVGKHGIMTRHSHVVSYPTHMHAYYEMIQYQPFDGYVKINNHVFPINTPTISLIAPSDFHMIKVHGESKAEYVKVSFDESILNRKCSPPASSIIFQERDASHNWICSLFREMISYKEQPEYLALLAATAVQFITLHGETVPSIPNLQRYHLCAEAVRILNEQFTQNITLVQLAEQLKVSPQYLSRILSDTTGVSYSEYLCTLRLRRAAELLINTSLSVTEVCFACGYQNLSNFLRSFKKAYNVTPGMYRIQNTSTILGL